MEKWVDVKYNTNYQVSNLGKVRRKYFELIDSIGRVIKYKEMMMSESEVSNKNGNGRYKGVRLQGKSYRLHRVVYFSFNPNDDKNLDINHIDHNKNNNKLDNLELVTKKENTKAYYDFHNMVILEDKTCICGIDIQKKSSFCKSCSNKDRTRKTMESKPKLETLLNDVSIIGYTNTGKKYGVSDNSIRKWIKNWYKLMEQIN